MMTIKKISAGTGADIYYCPVENDPGIFLQGTSDDLPEKYCSRRKCELLTIHYIIHQTLGYKERVNYGNDGKPFIPGLKKHISISHSQEYAAVMVSDNPCGVDVEKISERAGKVIRRFLNESEMEVPDGLASDLYYTIMWSAKESLFKITGRPDYLKDMRTVVAPSANSDKFVMEALSNGFVREFSLFYTTFDNNVLTWAYER